MWNDREQQFNKLLQFGSFDCDFWGLGNVDETIENQPQFDKKKTKTSKQKKGISGRFLKDKLQKIMCKSDPVVLQ